MKYKNISSEAEKLKNTIVKEDIPQIKEAYRKFRKEAINDTEAYNALGEALSLLNPEDVRSDLKTEFLKVFKEWLEFCQKTVFKEKKYCDYKDEDLQEIKKQIVLTLTDTSNLYCSFERISAKIDFLKVLQDVLWTYSPDDSKERLMTEFYDIVHWCNEYKDVFRENFGEGAEARIQGRTKELKEFSKKHRQKEKKKLNRAEERGNHNKSEKPEQGGKTISKSTYVLVAMAAALVLVGSIFLGLFWKGVICKDSANEPRVEMEAAQEQQVENLEKKIENLRLENKNLRDENKTLKEKIAELEAQSEKKTSEESSKETEEEPSEPTEPVSSEEASTETGEGFNGIMGENAEEWYTLSDTRRIREGKGQSFEIVVRVSAGEKVRILEPADSEGWMKVEYRGEIGYMNPHL